MDSHRSTCPKESINCDYADVSCDFIGLREKMQQHYLEGVQMHLHLATEVACEMVETQTGTCNEARLQIANIASFGTSKRPWFSRAFYTSPGGYKMRISVCVSSYDARNQAHAVSIVPHSRFRVAVFLRIMEGKHNSSIKWPTRGKFQVEILNQEQDESHLTKDVAASTTTASITDPHVCSGRVCETIGSAEFLLSTNGLYVKKDTMYFRVKTIQIKSATKS